MADTWSPTLTAGHNTLSGGNLTATHTNGIYHDDKTLSNTVWSGKVYFEVTVVNSYTMGNTRVGIADSAQLTLDGNGSGGDSSYMVSFSGQTYLDGTSSTNYAWGGANGDEICVAIDIPNQLIWWRLNSGNWNNSGTANPATGVGGISFAGGSLATVRGMVSMFNDDESVIARMTAANFQHTPPSGFAEPPGVVAYTLAADVGTYALTGRRVELTAVKPNNRLFRHGGVPSWRLRSVLGINSVMQPAPFYSLRVGDAGGAFERQEFFGDLVAVTAYTLTAAVGTYTLTGQDVLFPRTYRLAADVGTYTLTGVAVGTNYGRRIAADAGAYTLTGQDVGLLRGFPVTIAAGSYALTGQDVGLSVTRVLGAALGTYTLTGVDVGLLRGLRIAADVGAYTLTGNDVSLTYTPVGAYILAADRGTYALTGIDVALRQTRIISAEVGAYVLTGNAVGLTYTPIAAPVTTLHGGNGGTATKSRATRSAKAAPKTEKKRKKRKVSIVDFDPSPELPPQLEEEVETLAPLWPEGPVDYDGPMPTLAEIMALFDPPAPYTPYSEPVEIVEAVVADKPEMTEEQMLDTVRRRHIQKRNKQIIAAALAFL